MKSEPTTRRAFVADAGRLASAGWLALQLPWLASLASCGAEHVEQGARAPLSAAESNALRAFAAQILPSGDGAPNGAELGAARFAERVLTTPFFAASAPVVRAGLADLDTRARTDFGRSSFDALASTEQVAIMRDLEHTAFFAVARSLVVIGAFAEPSYGGNAGGAGWVMVGIDHQPAYTAPYGWYDAQASLPAAGGA